MVLQEAAAARCGEETRGGGGVWLGWAGCAAGAIGSAPLAQGPLDAAKTATYPRREPELFTLSTLIK